MINTESVTQNSGNFTVTRHHQTYLHLGGYHGGAVGQGTTLLQVGRPRFRFPMVSLEFLIDINLLIALWPWGDLACSRNEYQEYSLRGEGPQCVGLTTLPPS